MNGTPAIYIKTKEKSFLSCSGAGPQLVAYIKKIKNNKKLLGF